MSPIGDTGRSPVGSFSRFADGSRTFWLVQCNTFCPLSRSVGQGFIEQQTKPSSVTIGALSDVPAERVRGHPGPVNDFIGMRVYVWAINNAKEDVVVFMLDQRRAHPDSVRPLKRWLYGAVEPHFLSKPAMSPLYSCLPGRGMATAGVGPEASGVIFRGGALLEKEVAPGIEDEHGKSSMEPSVRMCPLLFGGAEGAIVIIHEEKRGGHKLRERNDG